MNNLIRFKLKMLIVLTFCVFMTFTMLVYVMRVTEKCENSTDETCLQVSKNPVPNEGMARGQVQVQVQARTNTTGAVGQIVRPSPRPDVKSTSASDRRRTMKRKAFDYMSSSSLSPSSSSSVTPGKRKRSYGDRKFPLGQGSRVESYETRRRRLRDTCSRYFDASRVVRTSATVKLNHVLIDDRHKILYCYVPKVACTNWKRIFLVLTGKARNVSEVVNLPASQVHAKNLFKTLQNYTVAEALNATSDYTKFIFVRHPFERLLSAYRNKLEQHYDSSKYFQARFGKYIIRNFRKNPTNLSLARGDDVTFAEFVEYIVASDPAYYNEHWQRVTDLCHPCLIGYDFVGKYDTLIEDSNYLLSRFGTDFRFPVLPKPSTTATNLKKYYDTLGRDAIVKLFKIYEMDFRLFGYDLADTFDWFAES